MDASPSAAVVRLAGDLAPQIVFTPHLLPVNRGILSSIYLRIPPDWSEEQARRL